MIGNDDDTNDGSHDTGGPTPHAQRILAVDEALIGNDGYDDQSLPPEYSPPHSVRGSIRSNLDSRQIHWDSGKDNRLSVLSQRGATPPHLSARALQAVYLPRKAAKGEVPFVAESDDPDTENMPYMQRLQQVLKKQSKTTRAYRNPLQPVIKDELYAPPSAGFSPIMEEQSSLASPLSPIIEEELAFVFLSRRTSNIICSQCYKSFTGAHAREEYEYHYQKEYPKVESSFRCCCCRETFGSTNSRKQHELSVHGANFKG
ncbi:hypothetical protein EK21DRAFT_111612 [Setomelanomma holmii]|uniref:C2H2-type domain-containing protein n=1 Tax=Setomelanomma holmii TaxID=210430 RepID=A0A9P4HAP5_9PLEO|nr:hypothetical protein EK21DRAFT_111612 [Setomelanomma holmii]